jgi:hypothetical protein
VSPALVKRSKQFEGYAVALENDKLVAEFTVFVGESGGSASDALESIAALAVKQSAGKARILTKSLVEMQGVKCAQLEFVGPMNGRDVQKLLYVMPVGDKRALIALEAPPEQFSKFRPAFQASVASVRGLQAPSGANTALIGAVLALGVVGVWVGQFLVRSRKAKRRRSSARKPERANGS